MCSLDSEVDVKARSIELIESKYGGEMTVEGIVGFLFDVGIMEKRQAMRSLVKSFYYKKLRENGNHSSHAKIDAAIEFDVSVDYVSNCIYKFKSVLVL